MSPQVISQPIKDWAEILDHTLTLLTIFGALIGWYITRQKRQEAGAKAVEQINKMATNDLPHIHSEAEKTNAHLEQQTVVLGDIRDGIIKLVDRTER